MSSYYGDGGLQRHSIFSTAGFFGEAVFGPLLRSFVLFCGLTFALICVFLRLQTEETLTLQSLLFWISLFFCLSPISLAFLCVSPFFSKDFRSSAKRKTLMCSVASLRFVN